MVRPTKKWILPAAVGLVVLAFGAWYGWYTGTPEYKARRLVAELTGYHEPPGTSERWLVKLGLGKQRRTPKEIRKDLVALGEPAVRPLISALEKGDYDDCSNALIGGWGGCIVYTKDDWDDDDDDTFGDKSKSDVKVLYSYWPNLYDYDHIPATGESVRLNALVALGEIRPPAKEAIPLLIQTLNDEDLHARECAAWALGRIGPPAVPALIEDLKDGDINMRMYAIKALGRIGPAAENAIPLLIQTLNDQDLHARECAAWALGRIGPPAVPALIEALKDEDFDVRMYAIKALGQIGPAAEEAVDPIIEALKDKDSISRLWAAKTLAEIAPAVAGKEAAPILIRDFKDNNPVVRFMAVCALGEMGPPAVPGLVQALKDEDGTVRAAAAAAMEKIGPAAKEAIPALREAMKDKDKGVREAATEAIKRIRGEDGN